MCKGKAKTNLRPFPWNWINSVVKSSYLNILIDFYHCGCNIVNGLKVSRVTSFFVHFIFANATNKSLGCTYEKLTINAPYSSDPTDLFRLEKTPKRVGDAGSA